MLVELCRPPGCCSLQQRRVILASMPLLGGEAAAAKCPVVIWLPTRLNTTFRPLTARQLSRRQGSGACGSAGARPCPAWCQLCLRLRVVPGGWPGCMLGGWLWPSMGGCGSVQVCSLALPYMLWHGLAWVGSAQVHRGISVLTVGAAMGQRCLL